MSKYRGKHPNYVYCKHAGSRDGLMVSTEVKETCPNYDRLPHHIAPYVLCDVCKFYEREMMDNTVKRNEV